MPTITLTDDFDYRQYGEFTIVNNTWNNQTLVNGVDYTQTVTFDPSTAPNDVTFDWDWGAPADRVFAYPEIVAGYKAWDQQGSSILTSRVDDLAEFTVSFDLSMSGQTAGFNIALEFWLTSTPRGGGPEITTEVMVWLHNGDLAPDTPSGNTYSDGTYSADVWEIPDMNVGNGESWHYIAMATRADFLSGEIDLHDVLVYLQRRNLINPTDYITGFEIGAEIIGGTGSFSVNSLSYQFARYHITEAANRVAGGARQDIISARGGNDFILGNGGNDRLDGGEGNDIARGGTGMDRLYGANGNDRLFGDADNDVVNGGSGNDFLYGGTGADILSGGAGFDYARYDDADHGNLNIRLDNPRLNRGTAAIGDTYAGVEGVVGGAGHDTIFGNHTHNALIGSGGSDVLDGLSGNDVLNGGTGADRFRFSTGLNVRLNVDHIVDFTHGADKILLSRVIFAALGPALDAKEFRQGNAAQDANDHIIYQSSTGRLFYDSNGKAPGSHILFAILEPGTILSAADFMLV